jgi:hypothetical protein
VRLPLPRLVLRLPLPRLVLPLLRLAPRLLPAVATRRSKTRMIRQSVSGLAKDHALNIKLARDRTQNRFPLLLIAR